MTPEATETYPVNQHEQINRTVIEPRVVSALKVVPAGLLVGTLPGIMLGVYLHQFVPPATLRRGFAAFLVVVGAFILIENFGAVSAIPRER